MTTAPTAVDLAARIPNNVGLGDDRRLQRALEQWQPKFLEWWHELGPTDFEASEVYLRTAIDVGQEGWANFGYLKMPEYRWGIFLAPPEADRRIGFGEHKGEPVWQEVPGEFRGDLRRLIVVQGDTEPASVEQQRALGHTAPSLYDLRNLFQVNVEEGRHLWAMVYLLFGFFGRDGRDEAESMLGRHSGRCRQAPDPRRVQRADPGLAVVLPLHLLHRSRRQVPARGPQGECVRPACADVRLHAEGGGPPHVRGRSGHRSRGATDRRADGGARYRRRATLRRDRSRDAAEVHQLPLLGVTRPLRK